MRVMQLVVLCVGMAGLAAQAAEPTTRRVQSVPVEYVSPGASGSIGVSSSSQSYDAYGVPSEYGSTQSHSYGGSSVQQGGGIRQSVKYPGGLEVQRYPGQTQYEEQRQR